MSLKKSDQALIALIETSVQDPDRKNLYASVVPKLSSEEKLTMMVELLEYSTVQMENSFNQRLEEKLEEIYDNQNDEFTTGTFEALADEVLNDFAAHMQTETVGSLAAADSKQSHERASEIAEKLRQLADEVNSLMHQQ